MIKKILAFILFLLIALLIWQYELVGYGLAQAKGQLTIVWKSRPVEEVLADSAVADSVKQRLLYIQEVRKYATDSLGILPSDNYTTFFDQQGQASLWVVTACQPFALEPKLWSFPILGSFPYKGFFVEEKAKKEMEALEAEGWDAKMGTVSGWSTLGWLKDPILSNMLFRGDGSLAELIIHELTHGTLYVKDSVDFNENLASFVGEIGAERFLAYYFGPDSPELEKYKNRGKDTEVITQYILQSTRQLDSLYRSFPADMSVEMKKQKKEAAINGFIEGLSTLPLAISSERIEYLKKNPPNNAFFMSYVRYNGQKVNLEKVFYEQFGGDFQRFFTYYKERYPSSL